MQSTCSSWTTVAIDIFVADVCTMLFFKKCNWPNYAKLKQEFSCGKRMTIINKYSRLTRYIFLLVSISFFSDFKPLRSPSKLCLEFFFIIRNTHAGFASDTCNTCYLIKHKLLKSSVTISFPDVRKVFFQSELVQDFLKTNLSVFAPNNLFRAFS